MRRSASPVHRRISLRFCSSMLIRTIGRCAADSPRIRWRTKCPRIGLRTRPPRHLRPMSLGKADLRAWGSASKSIPTATSRRSGPCAANAWLQLDPTDPAALFAVLEDHERHQMSDPANDVAAPTSPQRWHSRILGPVFYTPALIIVALVVLSFVAPLASESAFSAAKAWVANNAGWFSRAHGGGLPVVHHRHRGEWIRAPEAGAGPQHARLQLWQLVRCCSPLAWALA